MANKRKHTVVFNHDKNGRKVAYYVGRSDYRLFRMALAKAEIEVATDAAYDGTDGWRDYFKRIKAERLATA